MRRKLILAAVLVALALSATVVYATVTLTTKISLGFTTEYTSTGDLSNPRDSMSINRNIELTSGTGANQANVIFTDSRTLTDTHAHDANEVLDVYASGSLKDPLGTALTISALKVIYVYNTSTTSSLLVGGGTTPVGFFADPSDILTIPPGGKWVLTAPNATGWDVTTNKNIKLQQSGGTGNLVYEIILIGVD